MLLQEDIQALYNCTVLVLCASTCYGVPQLYPIVSWCTMVHCNNIVFTLLEFIPMIEEDIFVNQEFMVLMSNCFGKDIHHLWIGRDMECSGAISMYSLILRMKTGWVFTEQKNRVGFGLGH